MNKKSIGSAIIKIILSLAILFLLFWFELPPINIRAKAFWSFVVQAVVICVIINAFGYIIGFIRRIKTDQNKIYIEGTKEKFSLKALGKPVLVGVATVVVVIVLSIVMSIIGAQIFNAQGYHDLITFKDSDFITDISELEMNQIPVVDRESSQTLGKRKLGEMSEYVSQFEIAENYTQINYKDEPCRVTPLIYGDPIKWFNNQSEGIPAYIRVNVTTQKTELVTLKEGIKYSESDYFLRNIHRYLRFKYPTKIFDDVSFEIDEAGTPYWVASTITYKIGFWSGEDIEGAVLVNAVTGETQYYGLEEIPTWVDQVYSSDMIVEQIEYNGKYRGGYWNSIFGQKGVVQPTEGYNYLAIDDDVWLYTGMTSVVSDESNVGFVLVNLRTKETKYYKVPGAKEYSAMSSAEGAVQEKKYTATFPLLLNVSDRPTYFMSLKDDAGLVKMYAFVDVQAYQVLGTGTNVDAARENYIANLKRENIKIKKEDSVDETITFEGEIVDISTAVVEGNTKYYILAKEAVAQTETETGVKSDTFVIDISKSDELPFAKVKDKITITYTTDDKGEKTIKTFELK